MPPFIPQKRRFSSSSSPDSRTVKASKKSKPKPSLFDTADKPSASASLQDNKDFLDGLHDSDSNSVLSDIGSDEFEDVISSKKRKISHVEDDDEVDWEDAMQKGLEIPSQSAPEPSGDLELTLDDGSHPHFGNSLGKKKGPSKIERQIRVSTHCMHVQFLLFHNLVRNGWACDKEVQEILVGQLPETVKKEVVKWKIASGLISEPSTKTNPLGNKKKGKKAAQNERNQRDWGKPAERQEKGAPNMSHGDPLIRLLKYLAAYWKKRWTILAPGLRKQGYKPLTILEEEIASFKKGKHNAVQHGERINSIQDLRLIARKCEGSRDVGAQLFTALIRGLGIDARLVASLQPIGFGWSKAEEASATRKESSKKVDVQEIDTSGPENESSPELNSRQTKKPKVSQRPNGRKHPSKGAKDEPIDLSEELGDGDSQGIVSDDNDSVVDVTPRTPRKRPNMSYDRDMVFPTYWTETISPITNEVYPVEPFILSPAVATNSEHLALFESRGAKVDKAKQVFAYVIGYNSDGTAKDVTTRYLKRHIWPGRTKGVRMPVEKIPVYNHRGKIKRYEDYDWFKTVISAYQRYGSMRTAADDLEETKDLKAVKPEKKEQKAGEDTLQGYKTSAEFVLERHLRREEAIRPGSKPVKTFASGKGEKAKEEPVWLRKDVEVCRTGESWHKEGRVIKAGETPMKMVPIRAVTLTRKREVEEAERDSGEKLKQGLYSWNQTDWIIPPPIKDGIIPKNAYNNIDCFVPTMVPKGAVHIPLRSTLRICKRLNIDYAEAVTGFEFGNKRAVPVITGVVVASENENAVIDEWEKDEEERRIKEEGKREKAALATWRKWLMGLRIIQRVHEEYGGEADAHIKEAINPFTNQVKAKKLSKDGGELKPVHLNGPVEDFQDEDNGGGFLADDNVIGGGFLLEDHEEEVPQREADLTIEGEAPTKPMAPALATLTSDDNGVASDLESASKNDEQSIMMPNASRTTINGTISRKAKPTSAPSRQKTMTNGHDQGPPISSKCPDNKKPKVVIPASKSRVVPKRGATRKRQTAVTSPYFDHSDDEVGSKSSQEDSTSEETPARKHVTGKRKASHLQNRRLLRTRNGK